MSDATLAEPVELALSAGEHAHLELRRVGLTLCKVLDTWLRGRSTPDPLLAQSVADCRAQLLLLTKAVPGVDGRDQKIDDELARLERHLAVRVAACTRLRRLTPLMRLRTELGLSPFELDLLLLAALPEESAVWGSLFALLAGTDLVRRPTVHHAVNLWAPPAARSEQVRNLIEGPLLGYQMVSLDPTDAPFADRAVRIATETWHALCGVEAVDPQLAGTLGEQGPPAIRAPVLPPALAAQVAELAARAAAGETVRLVLFGSQGCGRRSVARYIAAQGGTPLVELRLPQGEASRAWCAASVRHALARGAGLILSAAPAAGEAALFGLRVPERMSCYAVLPERTDVNGGPFEGALRLHLPLPAVRERRDLWRVALDARGIRGLDVRDLSWRYRLSGGEIFGTAEAAQRLARLNQRSAPDQGDVARSVRERPALRLEALARRRRPKAGWDDLIAPAHLTEQLREMTLRVRHRDLVFDEWNVVGHTSRQTGVLALFTGPSGTGKTLAAEVIAGQLDLDLYCVDLSQVVSKYIGETEKNLSRVFDAIEGTAAVIFFDEADGLFGKRTETRDAHDRYANLEVSYLLARLEAFSGVAVLASNFRQNIDSAFLRRMDFVLEFAQPDTEARRQLWKRHLTCGAPLAGDIDVARLAELFPVSGGHIRNAVVSGAFGAAAENRSLALAHLVAGMRREYEKVGKAFPSTSFITEEKKPWP